MHEVNSLLVCYTNIHSPLTFEFVVLKSKESNSFVAFTQLAVSGADIVQCLCSISHGKCGIVFLSIES